MPKFETTATFKIVDGMYLTTEADDIAQAEYDFMEMVKDAEPEAMDIQLENITEIE